jgi:uncharacterized protein (TIGR03382 family)
VWCWSALALAHPPVLLPLAPAPVVELPEGRAWPTIADTTGHWRDRSFLDVPVRVAGREVFGGGTSYRFQGGRLSQVVTRTPNRTVRSAVFGTPAVARSVGTEGVPAGTVVVEAGWYATTDGLLPVHRVTVDSGHGVWTSLVGADGALVRREGPPDAGGTLTVRHHERAVTADPLVESPLRFATVETASGALAVTDDLGAWSLPEAGTVRLEGPWFVADDRRGTNFVLDVDGDAVLDAPDDQGELDAFVFAHQVRDTWLPYAADHPWLTTPVNLAIDLPPAGCNAYYWGYTLHFYRPMPACWAPAQTADVVYHEWGHGLHFQGRVSGPFDLAASEGMADVVAWLILRDPNVAGPLFKDGQGFRDLDEVRRYPEDVDPLDSHFSGLILSGAMINLVGLWEDEPGRFESWLLTFMSVGPTLESAWDDALFADDDDGNVANGTPGECALARAFAPHGYGPLVNGWTLDLLHEPPMDPPGDAEIPLTVQVDSNLNRCLELADAGVSVVYAVDDGEPATLALTGSGDEATGALPALPPGAVVTYHFTGALDGTELDDTEFSFTVGEIAEPPPPDPTEEPAGSEPSGTDEPDPETAAGGCGCATGPSTSWAWLGLAGLAIFRRRR